MTDFSEAFKRREAEAAKRFEALVEEVAGRMSLLELPDDTTIRQEVYSRGLGFIEWTATHGTGKSGRALAVFYVLVERVNEFNPIIRVSKRGGRSNQTRRYSRLKSGDWNLDKAIGVFEEYIADGDASIQTELEIESEYKQWQRKLKAGLDDLGGDLTFDHRHGRFSSIFRCKLTMYADRLQAELSPAATDRLTLSISTASHTIEEVKEIIEAVAAITGRAKPA